MKKFVNDPQQFVPAEMLKGIAAANPGKLKYVPAYNLIMRADMPSDDKVSIIQGSDSGHEPAHVMAVGPGMPDAACPGDVFAAPPSDYVYETSKLMNSKKGVLHIINNYTGDRMAFDMGRELRRGRGHPHRHGHRRRRRRGQGLDLHGRAARRGRELLRDQGARRGLGQGCGARRSGGAGRARQLGHALDGRRADLVHAAGEGLAALRDRRRRDRDGRRASTASRAAGARSCAARTRSSTRCSAPSYDLPYKSGDEVAVMVNGLGGTPISELYLIYGRVHEQLEGKGIEPGALLRRRVLHVARHGRLLAHVVRLDGELKELLAAPARDRHAHLLGSGRRHRASRLIPGDPRPGVRASLRRRRVQRVQRSHVGCGAGGGRRARVAGDHPDVAQDREVGRRRGALQDVPRDGRRPAGAGHAAPRPLPRPGVDHDVPADRLELGALRRLAPGRRREHAPDGRGGGGGRALRRPGRGRDRDGARRRGRRRLRGGRRSAPGRGVRRVHRADGRLRLRAGDRHGARALRRQAGSDAGAGDGARRPAPDPDGAARRHRPPGRPVPGPDRARLRQGEHLDGAQDHVHRLVPRLPRGEPNEAPTRRRCSRPCTRRVQATAAQHIRMFGSAGKAAATRVAAP